AASSDNGEQATEILEPGSNSVPHATADHEARTAILDPRSSILDLRSSSADLEQAAHLLNDCLKADPEHEAGLWCMAALRCVRGQVDGLAAQAAAMYRLEQKGERQDARFYFLAAVCHLAAGEYDRVLESARKAAEMDPDLALESSYLLGWASWLRGDLTSA